MSFLLAELNFIQTARRLKLARDIMMIWTRLLHYEESFALFVSLFVALVVARSTTESTSSDHPSPSYLISNSVFWFRVFFLVGSAGGGSSVSAFITTSSASICSLRTPKSFNTSADFLEIMSTLRLMSSGRIRETLPVGALPGSPF